VTPDPTSSPTPGPTSDYERGRWRGRWIWAAEPATGRHTVVLARDVELERVPERVPARWCAIGRAALWVNGSEVGRGPVRSNPRTQPWDDRDLAPWLRAGRNRIGVLAVSYGGPNAWYLPGPPLASDLAQGAFVFEARLPDGGWMVSDDSWSARVLEGWTAEASRGISGRGRELLRAHSLPADWLERDPGWPAAALRRAMAVGEPAASGRPPSYPYGPFAPRPIAFPEPTDVPFEECGEDHWRVPRIGVGTLVVDAEGPAGAELELRIGEYVDAGGRLRASEHDTRLAVTLDGTRRALESLDLYGGQAVHVEPGPGVTLHGLTLRERTCPVAGDAAFACSDPELERIWAVGRRSVTINSTDAYTDCPSREQRAWTGDAVVHQLVDLTTNADWRLARRHPALSAVPRPDGMLPMAVAGDVEWADFTIIPDWALHWVHSVWNLHRYVGDRDEVRRLLGVAEGVIRWFEPFLDGRGLLRDVVGWVIIDWASVHTAGVCGPLNGLWGRALREFADMAEWLGDADRAAWARARHAALSESFDALWDPGRERYLDSSESGTASQHGQAAAVVGGLAPVERWPRLVELLTDRERRVHATFSVPDGPAAPGSDAPVGGAYLRAGHPAPWWEVDRLVAAQPFFRYVVHDALAAAGRADLVADACRDWTTALERCGTSLTETWFGGTWSHGWGATPTRDLMQVVLGVTPAVPGFGVARIEPALGGLAWARGRVPHPAGPIAVEVESGHDAPGRLCVTSPVPFEHAGRRREAGRHELPLGGP